MDYLVKSGEFEGPVHVLLELIQGRKLHVSEISLAQVTEDFLKYIADHSLSHSHISSFIVVASTLVLIKARSLLPTLPLTEEEETSISDLTERIRQYQIVQKYAELLAARYQKNSSFQRIWQDTAPVFAPDSQITTLNMNSILQSLFQNFPVLEKLPEKTMRVVVKLEEIIERITQTIQSGAAFHSQGLMEKYRNAATLVEKRQAKVFAVVSFLALLELVKKGIAHVAQEKNFENIELTSL